MIKSPSTSSDTLVLDWDWLVVRCTLPLFQNSFSSRGEYIYIYPSHGYTALVADEFAKNIRPYWPAEAP